MESEYFKGIEILFERLLVVLEKQCKPEQLGEIKDYICYGEYGLALVVAVEIFNEEPSIQCETRDIINKLAETMGFSSVENISI